MKSNIEYIKVKKNTYNKLLSFLSKLISDNQVFNSFALHDKEIISSIKELSFAIYPTSTAYEEKENLNNEIVKLQREIEIYKKNICDLNEFYEENIKEYKSLSLKYEQQIKINEALDMQLSSKQKEIDSLTDLVAKLNQEIDNKNKEISKFNKLSFKRNNEINPDMLISELTPFQQVVNEKTCLVQILKYLNINEIINFKNSHKQLYKLCNESICSTFLYSCKEYLTKNKQFSKDLIVKTLAKDISDHQDTLSIHVKKDSNEIERLFKLYLRDRKTPGKNLKNQILICLNFLERDVKIPLDIDSPLKGKSLYSQEQPNKEQKGKLTGLFKSFLTPSTEIKQKIFDSSIENSYLLNHLSQLNLQFDYKDINEIESLLNKIYTSNFTQDFIKEFNKEITKYFSGLLFYSNEAINDIKEIDYLKEIINQRFESYYKNFNELEIEVESLRRYTQTNKEIKEILVNQKNELEIKYSAFKAEMILQQQELNKVLSENSLLDTDLQKKKKENDFLKSKLISEYNKFKNEIESSKYEKIEILNSLFKLRKFLLKFNISDDGDVLIIDFDI